MTREKKVAGFLKNADIFNNFNFVAAVGDLVKDLRGEHEAGGSRDFSGKFIRTSYLEKLEYNEVTDITTISTRNSIYTCEGNLIKKCLKSDLTLIEGEREIYNMVQELEGF